MKRFDFRLEGLLKIRAHRERVWEVKLAGVTGACVLLEGRIQELREEKLEHSPCSFQGIPYPVSVLLARSAYVRRLEEEILEAERELDTKRREREKINKEYLAASRDRKVLDKLKERRSREHHINCLAEEAKALDEIAMGLAQGSPVGEERIDNGILL